MGSADESAKAYFFDNDSCDSIDESAETDLTQYRSANCAVQPEAKALLEGRRCPYCAALLEELPCFCDSGAQRYDEVENVSKVCQNCGFWCHHHYVDANGTERDSLYIARIKTFDLSDKHAPEKALLDWLIRHPEQVSRVHHRKLEFVVRDILREYFCCDFVTTTQTRDGGIDLYTFKGPKGPLIVEVKGYKSGHKIGVEFVRSLAGVLVRENACSGLIVTTSDFTSAAKAEADVFKRPTQHSIIFAQGVFAPPHLYDPALNPIFRDLLQPDGVVALRCRVRDPDDRRKVESGVGHGKEVACERTALRRA